MPKLKDLDDNEKLRAKTNRRGQILCIECEKNLAKVSEYGMLRRCTKCEGEKRGPTIFINEPNGMRTY